MTMGCPLFLLQKQYMKIAFATNIIRLSLLAALGTTGLVAGSCTKESDPVVAAQDYSGIDDAIIQKYLTDNAITNAQKKPSGLYYVPVTTNPTAPATVVGRSVRVVYTGTFMDGRVFDSATSPFTFVLGRGQVIQGWDEGIALMHQGDKAILLIPSALAYGPSGRSTIPPNTVLRFEVEVTNVL
jgi:hypothetical protein